MNRAVFIRNVKGLYGAEMQVWGALPTLARYVAAQDLRVLLKNYRTLTQAQIKRTQRLFRIAKTTPERDHSQRLKALLQESMLALQKNQKGYVVRDGILLSRLQRIVHFQIENYEVTMMMAGLANETKAEDVLRESLDEIIVMDERVTQLVERNMERRFGRYRIAKGAGELVGKTERQG